MVKQDLIDHSPVRFFDKMADGGYLENDQLNPDIDVENTKELVVSGQDEQLEAAVKALLEQLKK